MTDDGSDTVIRQAIGGDAVAIAWILAAAPTRPTTRSWSRWPRCWSATPPRLDRAAALAVTSRDRQVVAIARAHLAGDGELVDALARDHLVDYPDSLIVVWIASDPEQRERPCGPVVTRTRSVGRRYARAYR